MLGRIEEDRKVRGDFLWQKESYPVEVRLHGASTRYSAKKSYRIRFLEASPGGMTWLRLTRILCRSYELRPSVTPC
jgi:hypothetical protein